MEEQRHDNRNTSPQEGTWQGTLQSTLDGIVDSLGPKNDKYVIFLRDNKKRIGSEVSLVFSGGFGKVAAGVAVAAGLALRYILQTSSQYKIDLPVIDYALEKNWLFFKNFGNSIMSLFNCAEAICDFVNFAARKKVAAIMKQQAQQVQGTDQLILFTTASEIERRAGTKLIFDSVQTVLLLGASGLRSSPEQRLIINGLNTIWEGRERHRYGSSVFYYISQLAKAVHGKMILGGMILLTLASTFNNLTRDITKLSRNSIDLSYTDPHFEYAPTSGTYRVIGSTVQQTNQSAFREHVKLDLSHAKILAKSAKYFNGRLVYIYDIQIPGGYDDSLKEETETQYHRILSGRDLSEGGLDILGDLVIHNVGQDRRELPEPQSYFDFLFELIGATEPHYSPHIIISKSEYNNLFKK